jgi:hypothetical protein
MRRPPCPPALSRIRCRHDGWPDRILVNQHNPRQSLPPQVTRKHKDLATCNNVSGV